MEKVSSSWKWLGLFAFLSATLTGCSSDSEEQSSTQVDRGGGTTSAGGSMSSAGGSASGGSQPLGSGGSATGAAPGSGGGDANGTGGGPEQPSSGCGLDWSPDDAQVEDNWSGPDMFVARREMMVAGVNRLYLVAVPLDYDSGRTYPLVVGVHGSGGSREQLRGYMNLERPGEGEAILVYPEGLVLPDRGSTGWDLGSDSDDLLFIDALVEKYSSELCVDKNRLFATGHSFGGCMSNSIGCYRGDVFRAVAPVAGCGPFFAG